MSINTLPRFTLETLTAAAWRVIDVSESYDSVEPEKFHEWTGDNNEVIREKACGAISYAAGYVTLAGYVMAPAEIGSDQLQLTFTWTAAGDVDGTFADLYDFKVKPDAENIIESLESNFVMVDEDGEELDHDDRDILDFLKSTQPLWESEALALCPKESIMTLAETTTIHCVLCEKDVTQAESQACVSDHCCAKDFPVTTDDMEEFTIERDDEPSIFFVGEQIGHAASSFNNASSNYSGSNGRRNSLTLYRTRGGKLVCEKIGFSQWQGEKTRHSGAVCETEAEVMKFFGFGWLAKELYEDADIKASVNVE